MEQACWLSVFGTTYHIDGRIAASTIASACIVLLAFEDRPHVSGWQQTNLMAELADLACPVMRGGTGLDSNSARRQFPKEREDLTATASCAEQRRHRFQRREPETPA